MAEDFLVRRKLPISSDRIITVMDEYDKTREINGLIAASAVTGCKNCKIVTFNQTMTLQHDGISIEMLPAWRMNVL